MPSELTRPRKRLVLDAGGVLFAEGWREHLGSLAEAVGLPGSAMIEHYNGTLRNELWTGALSLEQFWAEVARHLGYDEQMSAALIERSAGAIFGELPALARLQSWAEAADELWILSNHRHEWLRPALAGAEQLFERLIISSEVGLMKPEPAIYASLREGVPAEVLFVDDKLENLEAALAAGAVDIVVQADAGGEWIAAVDAWLGLTR